MFKVSRQCYCAFCRSERLVYVKRHLSLIDFSLSAATSALLSVIVWQDLDPRAFVFFAFCLGFSEIFIQVRWRLSIACPRCGFDPVLYKKNPTLAADRVKNFMARRREGPLSAFAPMPKLPVIVKKTQGRKTRSSTDIRV